jgi:HEAT repeat protein
VAAAFVPLGDPNALEPLIAALAGADGQHQSAVAAALGELGDPRAVEPLIAALAGADGQPRDAVAAALGALGDPRAVEPLITALAGADGQPRDAVAAALGALGDPRAVEPLIASKQAQKLAAPSIIVAALASLSDHSALQEFHDLMRGPSPSGRCDALWALARCERSKYDRILLSRDADALAPGIDPEREIGLDEVAGYARTTNLSSDEVRKRYEKLQRKYLLRLTW